MKNLILIGGGGHCKSVIDVVEAAGSHRIAGILDPKKHSSDLTVCGYEVLGDDNLIDEYVRRNFEFLITVGQISENSVRMKVYENLLARGADLAVIIAPTAAVSKHAVIGKGTIVMHQSVVNAGAKIGVNCILNTSSIIEHDSRIGDHCHLSTMAVVNADCDIADHCFVGSNTVVNRGLRIGPRSVIGSSSLVTKNLTGNRQYMGIPVEV